MLFFANWTTLSRIFQFFWIIQNHKTEVGIFHEPLKLCGWFFQGRYSSSISLISIKLFSSHMYFLITGSFIMAKKTQKSRQWGSLQAHYFMNRSNVLAHFFRVVSPQHCCSESKIRLSKKIPAFQNFSKNLVTFHHLLSKSMQKIFKILRAVLLESVDYLSPRQFHRPLDNEVKGPKSACISDQSTMVCTFV